MEKETAPFVKDPHLLSAEEFPELIPYKSLDASRLKIIGEGQWRMADYLDGPLWLPFQEPSFLCMASLFHMNACRTSRPKSRWSASSWQRFGIVAGSCFCAPSHLFQAIFHVCSMLSKTETGTDR
jgi:hypothetical protein